MEITETLAIISVIGFPCVIAIVAIVIQYYERKRHYEAMTKAIELGKTADEIKEIFAVEKRPAKNGIGFLRGGIIVTGIGLGIAAIALILGEFEPLTGAAFVTILGLSLIVVYVVTGKKRKD